MLKVIIADDEARVCSLIKMLIDWEALGMELAGTAANGLEALELVERCRPDILITDIRMPGCHGLELIERAKKISPQLEIVIISGYAHFEYAQSAIRHGVGDYLLKPINQQELMTTLEKLGQRCLSRRQLGSEVEQLRKSSREDTQQLQGRLMQDLLSQRLSTATAGRLWEEYRFRAREGLLQVALLKMDYEPGTFAPASFAVLTEKAEKVFRQEVGPVCLAMLTHFGEGVGGVLLNYAPDQGKGVRKRLRACLNQLEAQRAMFGGLEFSLAVGPAVGEVEKLPEACLAAVLTAMERLTEGTGRMLEHLPPPSGIDRDRALKGCRALVEERAEHITRQEVDAAVDQIEQEVRRTPHVRGSEIHDLVLSAGRMFLQRPEIQGRERLLSAYEAACRQASRAERLFAVLRDMLSEQLALIAEQQRSGATRPIRVARQYVQQHYHEPITLEQVCEAAGFSASYFSAMFKKETGEGFVKYLTRVRIEHAKELLQQTNLPVTDICSRVGYNDLKHFTQTFKKETSLSPGQYRKLYG